MATTLLAPVGSDATAGPSAATVVKGGPAKNFVGGGPGTIRLAYRAFDPLADGEPAVGSRLRATARSGKHAWWLVQLSYPIRRPARDGVLELARRSAGYLPEATFVLEMTPEHAARARRVPGVRWVGPFHPAYKLRPAMGGAPSVLALRGRHSFRAFMHRGTTRAGALEAVGAIDGVRVDVRRSTSRVVAFTATARSLPAIARLHSVRWIAEAPVYRLDNYNARWASDTGERDSFVVTAPGNLTGAGQTAAVADTGVNYVTDVGGNAQRSFADFDAAGVSKIADYVQVVGGDSQDAMFYRRASGSGHRKVAAYYDLGGDGYEPSEASNHGTHTAGSIAADYPDVAGVYGTFGGRFDGQDGMAPGARIVIQDVASGPDGALGGLPADQYDLYEQVYDANPRTGTAVTHPHGSDIHEKSIHSYDSLTDARTHNYSIGPLVPVFDTGDAESADEFVYDHEDFVVHSSAGNDGAGIFTINGSPNISKNTLSSCASANGRQPMVTLDSAAIFSSHGPTGDLRIKPDVCTPGQIVVSPKGGTSDADHYLQGTSMSTPVLTGLSTLVREYFYEGFGPAPSGGVLAGYAPGVRNAARRWNPSAALVKATLINSADRMRGRYTGDEGSEPSLDGQWPSAGQGWGRVELDNALAFGREARRLFAVDVWNSSPKALDLESIDYSIPVVAGQPFEVTLVWADPPSGLGAGTTPLVNNLDLTVTGPDGTSYVGNNFTTQSGLVFNTPAGDPSMAVSESRAGEAPHDVKNNVEAVRIEAPAAGTYTIHVDGGADATNLIGTPGGKQGYALVASGLIGAGAAAQSPPQETQKPVVSGVEITPVAGDLAMVTWKTNEPTSGTVLLKDDAGTESRFADVHNPSSFPGLETPQNENAGEYVDKKVVGTMHEVRLTGLKPGSKYTVAIEAVDLAKTANTTTTAPRAFTSTNAMYQPAAVDQALLVSGHGTAGTPLPGQLQTWGQSTQLYVGTAGSTASDPPVVGATGLPRNKYVPAFMFRLPAGIAPNEITGASVELTAGHDVTNHYTDDLRFALSLLDSSAEQGWGPGKRYEDVAEAAVDAVAKPQTGLRRGGGTKYAFSFSCAQLASLRENLAEDYAAGTEGRLPFRLQSDSQAAESLFSFEFGYGRRSRGPEHRPRLILQMNGVDPQPCTATKAPSISDVRVQSLRGDRPTGVVVTWRTDVPSSSIVLYREEGAGSWLQTGVPVLSRTHFVSVEGLKPFGRYEFAVRSRTCNGLETTDDNADRGYGLFTEAYAGPLIDQVYAEVAARGGATVVRWVTDMDSTSVVQYGTGPALGSTASAPGSTRNHGVELTDLKPCTTYYFRVASANGAGTKAAGKLLTFVTPSDQLRDVAAVASFDSSEDGYSVKTASEGLPPTTWARNGGAMKITIGGIAPGYGSGVDTRLVSPAFSVRGGPLELAFTETFHSEPDFDFGIVEYSTDGGRSWKAARAISGVEATQPREVKVGITGVPAGTVLIGFRWTSDSNTEVQPGWSVDDVILREVLPCSGLAKPTAPSKRPERSPRFVPAPATGPVPARPARASFDIASVATDVNPKSSSSPAASNGICVRVLGARATRRPALPATGVDDGALLGILLVVCALLVRRRLTPD